MDNDLQEIANEPTCTLDMSTRIFAAGLSTPMDLSIVAPSFVTSTWPSFRPIPHKILSIPCRIKITFNTCIHENDKMQNQIVHLWFSACIDITLGPSVDLTRSPTAIAPTKDDNLAVSAFSSSASFFNTRTGFKET